MATLSEHIRARSDKDLLARLVAAAEVAGMPNPQSWAEAHAGKLVSVEVAEGQTIADIHAYAVATYNPTPLPGVNPAAVTDAHIKAAIQAIPQG